MQSVLQATGSLRGLLLVSALAAAIAGCSDRATGSPLAEARRSPEALAEAALEAIGAGDEDALHALMITREEYENLLWPVLPDREQMPFEFVWSITAPRSRKARREAIREYGDLPLELVRVELGDDVEAYDEFVLYRDSRMVVRRSDTGTEGVLPLMDTLIEMDGGWKFMNFVE
jgi:hypothetical protein